MEYLNSLAAGSVIEGVLSCVLPQWQGPIDAELTAIIQSPAYSGTESQLTGALAVSNGGLDQDGGRRCDFRYHFKADETPGNRTVMLSFTQPGGAIWEFALRLATTPATPNDVIQVLCALHRVLYALPFNFHPNWFFLVHANVLVDRGAPSSRADRRRHRAGYGPAKRRG